MLQLLKILFNRTGKAYLPEIDAYLKYFNQSTDFIAYDSADLEMVDYEEYDIIWNFMGTDLHGVPNKLVVHEYASLSTGRFPRIKNRMKKLVNHRPNLRMFLNEHVRKEFGFNDQVPYLFRDMGVDESFLNVTNRKEFDYVYLGAITKNREIDKLLNLFEQENPGKICLIGNVEDEIYSAYKGNKDIIFTGKVNHSEVSQIASKAEYGINWIPNIYPYNIQTSTKLLEYLALGLKVITTDYSWVREFEEKENLSFYKINSNHLNFKELQRIQFNSTLNIEKYTWENILNKAQIQEKLRKISM